MPKSNCGKALDGLLVTGDNRSKTRFIALATNKMNVSISIIILLIALAFGGGYLISKPNLNNQQPGVASQDSKPVESVAGTNTAKIDLPKVSTPKASIPIVPKKDVETKRSETQQNVSTQIEIAKPPSLPPQLKRIEGLTMIELGGGYWETWDADAENDGIAIQIRYKNNASEIIAPDLDALRESFHSGSLSTKTGTVPISADVNLYTLDTLESVRQGYKPIKGRLVFSKHYAGNDVIYTSVAPTIRIPKEEISVNPVSDYQRGIVDVIIRTPEQGSFFATKDSITLYEK